MEFSTATKIETLVTSYCALGVTEGSFGKLAFVPGTDVLLSHYIVETDGTAFIVMPPPDRHGWRVRAGSFITTDASLLVAAERAVALLEAHRAERLTELDDASA